MSEVFDPVAPDQSVAYQMKALILKPLENSGIVNGVIVIDGLDEFRDEETVSMILSSLGQYAGETQKLGLKFLITSRPKVCVREALRTTFLGKAATFSLQEVESSDTKKDIRLFFEHEFLKLNRSQGGVDGWPDPGALELLCQRTAGLFFYAVEAAKSINYHFETSRDQPDLQRLLDNINLDSLYSPIINKDFIPPIFFDRQDKLRSIFCAVALAPSPISPPTIAALLGLESNKVFLSLRQYHVIFPIKEDNPIQPPHKSISTFLTDPSKSDQWFYICPRTHHNHHKNFFIACLTLIIKRGKKGREIDPVVTNMSGEKNEKFIDATLVYAYKSWHKHLTSMMLTDGLSKVHGPHDKLF